MTTPRVRITLTVSRVQQREWTAEARRCGRPLEEWIVSTLGAAYVRGRDPAGALKALPSYAQILRDAVKAQKAGHA